MSGAERRERAVPMEVLLEIRAAARGACRRHGLTDGAGDPDRMAIRALAAAAGLEAGLEGVGVDEARVLQREGWKIFGRAYECSAAAGEARTARDEGT